MSAPDLFAAIAAGDAVAVDAVLADRPAACAARNDDGLSTVMFALYHRQEELARKLADARGRLDIFEACALGDTTRVTEILDVDSSVVGQGAPDGFTPLHLASFFGCDDVVAMLLERGADANIVTPNAAKLLPIHSAVAARSVDVVRRLLDAGADPNVQQHGGWTPLHAAYQHDLREMVDLLESRGADSSVAADDGRTPKDMAPS